MSFIFGRFSSLVARGAGKPVTFIAMLALVLVWAVSGPFFGFSEAWQIVINTGTTIVTFLMMFVLQATQNRDGLAIQVKLDELIRASEAPNSMIKIEDLTEAEIQAQREAVNAPQVTAVA